MRPPWLPPKPLQPKLPPPLLPKPLRPKPLRPKLLPPLPPKLLRPKPLRPKLLPPPLLLPVARALLCFPPWWAAPSFWPVILVLSFHNFCLGGRNLFRRILVPHPDAWFAG
jgi:hypothetical protein